MEIADLRSSIITFRKMFFRQYLICPILLKIRLKESLSLGLSGIIVQQQKVADVSEKSKKQCVRKLKTKIPSDTIILFSFCTAYI